MYAWFPAESESVAGEKLSHEEEQLVYICLNLQEMFGFHLPWVWTAVVGI